MSDAAILPEQEPYTPDPRAGKHVIFRLAHGEFGVAVHKVREVMEMQEITIVPDAPAFVAGVINWHGKVIPVVDLRHIFELSSEASSGLSAAQSTARSCIMVVHAMLAATEQVLGIVVDEVLEVASLQASDLLGPEEFQQIPVSGSRDPAPYLVGVARTDGRIKLLLDIDEVLNNLDLLRVEALPAAA